MFIEVKVFESEHQLFLLQDITNWSRSTQNTIISITFVPFDGTVVKAIVVYK